MRKSISTTFDTNSTKWATANAIKQFDSIEAFEAGFTEPVDYLFSINNEHILTNDILRLARKYAINYHDALLPRYAGTHATSWALMNGESTHGITWHVIADKVDAGDILTQRTVDISIDETALSLNSKCYEAAISAFDELVEDIYFERVKRSRQDAAQRSFFPRHKQPENGGIITWTRRADEISSLVRALDFGDYPNALGTAKLAIESEFFVVKKVEVLDTSSSASAGTIEHIGPESLRIACADKSIVVKTVATADGLPLSISELSERFQLQPGYCLTDIEANKNGRINDRFEALLKETARNENYWVDKLSKLNPIAAPYSRVSPSVQTANYQTHPIQIPDKFLTWVGCLPGQNHFKVNLLAAFGVLLSRLTGSESFSIGYADQNISQKVGGLSGLFATTLPMRIDVEHPESVPRLIGSLLSEIEQIQAGVTYLRDLSTRYPQLGSDDKFSRDRLLPVTFVEVDEIETYIPSIESDLILAVSNRECYWIFNSNSLTDSDIGKISGNFKMLLESIAENPQSNIASLALITEDERNLLVVDSKGKSSEYPKEKCIHELFEERVKNSPEAIAIICDGDQLTYGDLNKRSNQLARHLTDMGIMPGELVGIAALRSIELIVGVIGILKAGAAYVPFDPVWPNERLRHIANDTGISVVISQQRFAQRMKRRFSNVICMDSDWELITDRSGSNPNIAVSSESAAYAIFTSGSTGKPKGVLISHRSLVNHAIAISNLYELISTDRVLQFAPFNFDVAAEELFPSLLSGATVHILSQDVQSSLKLFSEFLFAHSISVVNLPTSYWREWVSSLTSNDASITESIRLVVTGSEVVYPDDYNLWRRKIAGKGVRWLNAYGLTETTITSLVFEPTNRNVDLETVPIGKPIDNTDIYILDKNMQPVPYGIPGELYIGGDCLAIGYLNLPDVTAERFVANPFSPAGRIYKTGDLVRYLPDGNVEYLDRVDHQVKIRGFRIELGEIETVLSSHPELAEAVVIAADKKSNNNKLTAYFVPRSPIRKPDPSAIELWPSIGEYPVDDDLMYYALSTDEGRTSRYEIAIERKVKDKVVVEIGTGRDLILARLCLDAGAKKVYAIEAIDESYENAKSLIKSQGLAGRIELIKGFSAEVDLPEKADVCLSEIIGTIGGSEGVSSILNDARRFLKPDGIMIPERCVTRIAAVQLPDEVLNSPHFSGLSAEYAEKVLQQVGYEFDLRVCLKNFPNKNLLSDSGIFEDLDFTKVTETDFKTEITLKIKKRGRLDGFLLWLNLHTSKDLVIDSINEKSSWLPVYFPAFESGLDVGPGDFISAVCHGKLSDNGINPDYGIEGYLQLSNGEKVSFSFDSCHHKPAFKQTPFYQRLFSEKPSDENGRIKAGISTSELRDYLAGYLPTYMIPSAFIELDHLPLTGSGKVDRKALPVSEPDILSKRSGYKAPKNKTEKKLAEIWCKLLDFDTIGINDNFFDLGGNSLLAIR
ncbi:MAG: amino acid adenylation domain-containing protein, partial [Pyrinomonadaceae bacterium]